MFSNNIMSSAGTIMSVYMTNTTTCVTGDGTVYQLIFDTVDFDLDSNYNTNTGLFTASSTGYYFVNTKLYIGNQVDIRLNDSIQIRIVTPRINYDSFPTISGIFIDSNFFNITHSALVYLAIGDTVSIELTITCGGKNCQIM